MNPLLLKYSKKIFPIFALIAFSILLTRIGDCSHKQACESFKKSKFIGKVIKKYINTHQHQDETLVYLKETEIDSMIFSTDVSNFYSFVEIGDSIIKIEHSNEIRIANKDTSFFINFNCY